MTRQTLEGTSRKRKRVSGFRVRMRTHTGRRVIRARRRRGRHASFVLTNGISRTRFPVAEKIGHEDHQPAARQGFGERSQHGQERHGRLLNQLVDEGGRVEAGGTDEDLGCLHEERVS